jgi:hypothetical protein
VDFEIELGDFFEFRSSEAFWFVLGVCYLIEQQHLERIVLDEEGSEVLIVEVLGRLSLLEYDL